jgi:hypothetical protein
MDQIPKPIKRALRELAGRAYEIELGRALAVLHSEFGRWEQGEVTAFELSEAIHQFHQGRARELFSMYTQGHPKAAVAHAIHSGILDRRQVAPEVLKYLEGALGFFEASESAQ